jgi:acyl-CoA synthetase (AMP-forming)/AMP-acid ligase II
VKKGFTYVGELCRFLLAQAPGEYDRKHSIRFCSGNGLRQNLWTSFVERFNIKQIYEFYAATESNAYFCNKIFMNFFFVILICLILFYS